VSFKNEVLRHLLRIKSSLHPSILQAWLSVVPLFFFFSLWLLPADCFRCCLTSC
jgi:hypothetical protein